MDRRRRAHRPRPDARDPLTTPAPGGGASASAPRTYLLLIPLIVVAPALLLIVAAVTGRALETEVPATGDYAALELYTRLAAQGRQLLGPYLAVRVPPSRAGLLLRERAALRPLRRALRGHPPHRGLINVVAIALLLRRVGRQGGLAALLAAALVIALFISWRGPAWLFSAWNPNVAVLPFGLALVSFAAFAAGETRALPAAIVAGSFAAQTHLGSLPAVIAIGLTAALLLIPPVRESAGFPRAGGWHRGPLVGAALPGGAGLGPARDRAAQPARRNLAHIVGFSAAGRRAAHRRRGPRHRREPPPWAGCSACATPARPGSSPSAPSRCPSRTAPRADTPVLRGRAEPGHAGGVRRRRALRRARDGPAPPVPLSLDGHALRRGRRRRRRRRGARCCARGWRRPAARSCFLTAGLVALAVVSGRNLALAQSAPAVARPRPPRPRRRRRGWRRPSTPASARRATGRWSKSLRTPTATSCSGVVLALDKAGTRFAVRPFGPFRSAAAGGRTGRRTRASSLGPEARRWRGAGRPPPRPRRGPLRVPRARGARCRPRMTSRV